MFTGFSPETVDFLWGIRLNNNRDWFAAHKEDYVNHLYTPMKALGQSLFAPFSETPGNICKVSRIYRDARMHHPLPYKESLWICIRKDVQWWAEAPCLYFEIRPEGICYGFIFYKPSTASLEKMRQHWAANPKEILLLLKKTEKATGKPVTAETYKRPKPAPIPELAELFSWKGYIDCSVTEEFSPDTFGPELCQRVQDFLLKLNPLYEYFNRFCA